MLDPIKVAQSIIEHAGQEFHTVTGLPFTYSFKGTRIVISRTKFQIEFTETIKRACDLLNEGAKGKAFSDFVHGPSYIKPLLQDERIIGVQESAPNSVEKTASSIGDWFHAELNKKGSHWSRNKVGSSFIMRTNGSHTEIVNERSTKPHAHIVSHEDADEYFTKLNKVA